MDKWRAQHEGVGDREANMHPGLTSWGTTLTCPFRGFTESLGFLK